METNINNLEEKVLETQPGLVDQVENNIEEENNNEHPKKDHHFSALYAASHIHHAVGHVMPEHRSRNF